MEPYTSYLGYTSRLLCTVLFCVFAGIAPPLHAQPFTKKFIMPFHTCDKAISSNCNDPINHVTRLAESDNGTQWSLVLGFTPLKGGGIIPPVSVPDLIQRGNKAYLYVPSAVYIYDGSTGKWSSNTTYTITDESGASIRFVDPSPMLDAQGRIVLFFLNSSSSGQGMDPAGCSSYPCTKRFDSAIEVEGSDGKRFVMQSGPRVQITLDGAMLRTGSDPDIYYDGTKYVLYVSAGASTLAFSSTTLHGSYTPLIGTTGLLTSIGGVPCGHYDTETKRYWTFVQSNEGGTNVIKRAVHADFSRQLGASDFTTVMSASTLGPGDCVVVISNSGRTRDLMDACDIARKNGAVTIVITASGSPLASTCHIHLAADHPEGYDRYSPMVSRLMHLLIIDVLATCVALRIGSSLQPILQQMKENLRAKRYA